MKSHISGYARRPLGLPFPVLSSAPRRYKLISDQTFSCRSILFTHSHRRRCSHAIWGFGERWALKGRCKCLVKVFERGHILVQFQKSASQRRCGNTSFDVCESLSDLVWSLNGCLRPCPFLFKVHLCSVLYRTLWPSESWQCCLRVFGFHAFLRC